MSRRGGRFGEKDGSRHDNAARTFTLVAKSVHSAGFLRRVGHAQLSDYPPVNEPGV
jgi:hypothetical protein